MLCRLVNSHLHFKRAHVLYLQRQCRKSERGPLDPKVEGFTILRKVGVLLTVHLIKILIINQLDAQNLVL